MKKLMMLLVAFGLVFGVSSAFAGTNKVDVCHINHGNDNPIEGPSGGTYLIGKLINVSVKSWPAHKEHGDCARGGVIPLTKDMYDYMEDAGYKVVNADCACEVDAPPPPPECRAHGDCERGYFCESGVCVQGE